MNKTINHLSEHQLNLLKLDKSPDCRVKDLNKLILIKNGLNFYDCLELKREKRSCKKECYSKDRKRLKIIEVIKPITYQYFKNDTLKKARVISDNRDKFFASNPLWATYEQWEKIAKEICYKSNIEVSAKQMSQNQCELALDISMKKISADCVLILQAVKVISDCGEITSKRSKQECKIDHDILIKKHNDCTIDFNSYLKLMGEGYTYDILDVLYESGNKVVLKDGTTFIKSLVSEVTLDDLNIYDQKAFGKNRELLKEAFKDIKLTAEQKAALKI